MIAGAKKKKLGKLGPIMEKKIIPVETDANKLVNYVCGSNYLKTGEDIKVSLSQCIINDEQSEIIMFCCS